MKYSVIIGKNKYPNVRYDINIGKERLRGSTIYNVNKKWVTSTNPLEIKKSLPAGQKRDARELRNNLEKFEDFIDDTTARLKSQNLHSIKSKLKEEIEIFFGRTSEQEEDKHKNLFEFIDWYIELKENQTTNKPISKGTITDYRRFESLLQEYKADRKRVLDYRNINESFYNDFTSFLATKFKTNTIGKHIKYLKMFMSNSLNAGYHSNRKYNNFEVLKENQVWDYLTEEELESIFNGTENAGQDYFLLLAYTGMRVGDMLRLRKENIIEHKGVSMIMFLEGKNKRKRVFRITDKMQVVLDRWQGVFPNDSLRRKIKANDINQYLKSTIKNKTIRCHSAKRSFCTNEYIKGTPVEDIMRQSGHQTYAVFKIYIQDSGEEAIASMSERRDL